MTHLVFTLRSQGVKCFLFLPSNCPFLKRFYEESPELLKLIIEVSRTSWGHHVIWGATTDLSVKHNIWKSLKISHFSIVFLIRSMKLSQLVIFQHCVMYSLVISKLMKDSSFRRSFSPTCDRTHARSSNTHVNFLTILEFNKLRRTSFYYRGRVANTLSKQLFSSVLRGG